MKHLACIMDGNRRWARRQAFNVSAGHMEGAKAIQVVSQFCLDNAIPYLSLYTFSLENLKRPLDERTYLFDLLNEQGKKMLPDLLEREVKIKFIGYRDLFPVNVREMIALLEKETEFCTKLQLNFLFCYGSRQEIVDAVREMVKKVQQGVISEQEITEEEFTRCLWTAHLPEPDLIIRTGGATRLSNFLLYQAAYSELYFLNCLWPEISRGHLEQAASYFYQCKRNFGV